MRFELFYRFSICPFFCRIHYVFIYIRLVPAQDVQYFYTRSHSSALQNCAVLFSTNY